MYLYLMEQTAGNLIITTGDISDVDGFYALAKYAETGADVIFIMNYPAYFDNQATQKYQNDLKTQFLNMKDTIDMGLGFSDFDAVEFHKYTMNNKYNKEDINYFKQDNNANVTEYVQAYIKFMNKFDNDMFKAITVMAAYMCATVWNEAKGLGENNEKGELYFAIGGINIINPFSKETLKNEVLVYSKLILNNDFDTFYSDNFANVQVNAAKLVNDLIFKQEDNIWNKQIDYNAIFGGKNIYLDMNGSATFWNKTWETRLNLGTLKGFHVMGGVLGYETPLTVGPFPTLKRFPAATMNQLYHPSKTLQLFQYVYDKKIPIFVVPNNSIILDEKLTEHIKDIFPKQTFLHNLATEFYNSPILGNPTPAKKERKPFDYITALSLVKQINENCATPNQSYYITVDGNFGMTIVRKEKINPDNQLIVFNGKDNELTLFNSSLKSSFPCTQYVIKGADYSKQTNSFNYTNNGEPLELIPPFY